MAYSSVNACVSGKVSVPVSSAARAPFEAPRLGPAISRRS